MSTFERYPTLDLPGAGSRHDLVGAWREALTSGGEHSSPAAAALAELVAHDEQHEVRTRLAARVVVLDTEERVLTFAYSRGRILLPGGGVDPGETFTEAAVREVREETTRAATLHSPDPLFVLYHAILPDEGRPWRVQYALIYRADLDEGPLETGHREVRWLGPAERAELAPSYPLMHGIEHALSGPHMPVVMLP